MIAVPFSLAAACFLCAAAETPVSPTPDQPAAPAVAIPAPIPPPPAAPPVAAAAEAANRPPIPPPPPEVVSATAAEGATNPASVAASMLIQLRYQQTAVTIQPGLSSLVMEQYPSSTDKTLQLIRDTARATDGLRPRRLLLDVGGAPAKGLSWQVRLDFAKLLYEDPTQLVRWAYGEYQPFDRMVLTAGIFDIPFSLFETMDEAEIELAERGPTHELLHHMRLAERDLGLLISVTPLREKQWFQLTGGVMNGGADGGQSYRGPGLLAARMVSRPFAHLQLGAGLVWRPRPLTLWWEELRFYYQEYDKGMAYGVDATLSFARGALRAEWIAGDRTDNDVMVPLQQRRGDARTFMTAWAMALLYLQVGGKRVIPALRGEFLDTDREHPTGAIFHVSAALNVYFSERVRLLADLSRHFVQIGTRTWEYSVFRYDTDTTIGVLQLQLRL